jgi:hypothetical protein
VEYVVPYVVRACPQEHLSHAFFAFVPAGPTTCSIIMDSSSSEGPSTFALEGLVGTDYAQMKSKGCGVISLPLDERTARKLCQVSGLSGVLDSRTGLACSRPPWGFALVASARFSEGRGM